MNDELCELIDTLDELIPAPGAIGVYWNSTSKRWRIQLDAEDFLSEIELWDAIQQDHSLYPYELVADYGAVEVFCLVKELP
jgi:hypothetical protein